MATEIIVYRKTKYQLLAGYTVLIELVPKHSILTKYASLVPEADKGRLTISQNYCWDGPSGPTIDTQSFMRGSLVHDVLYQLIREGHLPESSREIADAILHRICIDDKMWRLRALWVWLAVRIFGGRFIYNKPQRIFTAP